MPVQEKGKQQSQNMLTLAAVTIYMSAGRPRMRLIRELITVARLPMRIMLIMFFSEQAVILFMVARGRILLTVVQEI